MSKIYKNLQKNIRKHLEINKEKAAFLDQKAGLSGTVTQRIINGHLKNPTLDTLEKISNGMGIPVFKLIGTHITDSDKSSYESDLDLVYDILLFLISKKNASSSGINEDDFFLMSNIFKACVKISSGIFDKNIAEYIYDQSLNISRQDDSLDI
ncbi:helix-turn-helix transcriptional regulator [Alphaproteobacteria bacterium]|nr:helix-turn-helix transcriptional regulator [Alphaproteobacteria bacterium]